MLNFAQMMKVLERFSRLTYIALDVTSPNEKFEAFYAIRE